MGNHDNISATRWPKQGSLLGKRVRVAFHYDTANTLFGTIVRDDFEEPFVTIISLDAGKVVLSTECQYSPIDDQDGSKHGPAR